LVPFSCRLVRVFASFLSEKAGQRNNIHSRDELNGSSLFCARAHGDGRQKEEENMRHTN
jgi:hypothetical protein